MNGIPRELRARARLQTALALLWCGLAAILPLQAQYEMKSGVYNRLSNRVPAANTNHIPPIGSAGSPTGDPTITPQYSNVVESSASAGPISSGYPTSVVPNKAGGVKLTLASVGTTFASGVPRYFYGDKITPPVAIINQAGVLTSNLAASYWRAEPVEPGEVLTNPSGAPTIDYHSGEASTIPALIAPMRSSYYYSPHAKAVFANTPGNVEVTWRSSVPDPTTNAYVFYKERFSVSSATSTPVRTMYWTEKSFNAPVVTIPTGKVESVNPVFSNVFPDTVSTEYVVAGASAADPNAGATEILRTLWFEKSNGAGQLHAYNQTGRILIEYLGALNSDGTHEFLGLDIVNVEQSLRPSTATIELGSEIRPFDGVASDLDETLVGSPVSTTSAADQVQYYGVNPRADGSLAYYAEQENDIEDRVAFYWSEPQGIAVSPLRSDTAANWASSNSVLFQGESVIESDTQKIKRGDGITAWSALAYATSTPTTKISWPKYLNKYLQIWPTDVTKFAQYTVGSDGSSTTSGTGLQFTGGKIPEIVYQDSTQGDAIVDTDSQRLIVNLGGEADQQNRSLLKFTGTNGGVWYVPLMTQAENRSGYLEGDGGAAVTGTAYVGERLAPPSTAYSLAGYISSGTSYSPTAYVDPFVSGVDDAAKGAIIPVNALPSPQNALTVWWFKKVPAKSAEFSDFYTPAKIGRYTLAYREAYPVASENFDAGATNWGVNTTTTLSGSNKFLGPFGAYAVASSTNVLVNSPVVTKTFAPGTVGADGLEIDFRLYRFDAWTTGQAFRVFVNGSNVINQALTATQVTANFTGTSTVSGITYAWTIAPVTNGYANVYGTATSDQSFDVSLRATPTTTDGENALAALSVGFGSNLSGVASAESFAIDDLVVSLPVPEIVLASNQGTGSLPTALASGTIYNQTDSTKVGYNPNEEHALMVGGRGYAMRDDLNVTSGTSFTSLPRALIQYTDPSDGRPAMAVYKVLRENPLYLFNYAVTAGTMLNQLSPMPLPLLPLPVDPTTGLVKNTEVDPGAIYHDSVAASGSPSLYGSFTFKDRKGYDWVYRGPHSTATPALGMQFCYTMRQDFYIPGRSSQPANGTILPYLRVKNSDGSYVGDPVTATPLTILYRPTWPTAPPTLSVGETLALPKDGLPAVRGQTSARVLYQQSIAQTGTTTPSVTLNDPTRAKTVLLNSSGVNLTALPVSLKTTSQNGKTYFQLAQPHLQQRFYFNPLIGDIGGLELDGQFVDSVAGEDYLNLNTLSPDDVNALKGLVINTDADKSKWDAAINALFTTVETFKENPAIPGTYIPDSAKTVNVNGTSLPEISSSDTAVDSYALTAMGKGQGYATLLFGDGEAFTPQGEPVSMEIIKVLPQLYKGDLKMISASNPLDEQTSLRHSGDFAAHPEYYDFEWRYSPSVNGTAPPLYQYSTAAVLGATTTTPVSNQWKMLSNPAADPSPIAPLDYSSVVSATTLSSSYAFSVNNAAYVPASNRPGKILLSTTGLTVTGSLPTQVIFSATLGSADGFVVYVNNMPALAYNLPAAASVPGNLALQFARSGLAADGLTYQFEMDPSVFIIGANRVEVALYSSQGASSTSNVANFMIDVPQKIDKVVAAGTQWITPTGTLTNSVVVGGSASSPLGNPLLVFSDNYFTMRYKAKTSANLVTGTTYSEWMEPVLVESWVKRVLDGINPFNQRQTDLYNNPISTDVSVITQAGKRWEGDVALNLTNIDDFGLIEIYETVLNRVKSQSIDAGTTTDSVNSTLLLAAGYLNDLYMTLGNEAWDDAQNPTIQIDGQMDSSDISSARFSFEGQVATLMDETLALLRGRDDFLSPGTKVTPAYNRLYWNYTNGINSGEPIYAVNYNIKEKAGSANANGILDASDAQTMFPQGHGDAYGHYLTALTGYYKLLTNSYFTWTPSTEGVSVLGQTVQVDYKDERKFAAAAAAVANTGVDILDFTARNDHKDGEENGWGHMGDGKVNSATGLTRHWGSDDWSARVFQGAYFNWVNANAMLPDVDNLNEGIQKIDRTTVPELNEIVSSANQVLSLSASLQAHLNTLGLATDAMTFDISASELAAGKSHFEQIYDRAVRASVNAKNAFHQAGLMNQMLRQQNNSSDDYNEAVTRQESAYTYQLTTLYGTPYAGDMGPGKLYVQGYTGPDLYHSYFLDRPSPVISTDSVVTVNFREPVNNDPFTEWSLDNPYNRLNDPTQYVNRTYTISKFSLGQFSDTVTTGLGKRGQVGTIQSALLDCYEAQVNLRDSTSKFGTLMNRFNRDYQLYSEFNSAFDVADAASSVNSAKADALRNASFALTTAGSMGSLYYDYIGALAAAAAEAAPTDVGLANDATAPVRAAIRISAETAALASGLIGIASDTGAALLQMKADSLDGDSAALIDQYNRDSAQNQHVVELEHLYDDVLATGYEINRRLSELQRANERVSKLYADAAHVLSERESFRQRAASIVQGYRTRDVVYRDFRNEELSQYKSLFDLAQTYTYCAAKAYDYETGLLNTADGEEFVNEVIGTYSIGDWQDDKPIESGKGDSGLASVLAGLQDEWSVVNGRLGINNPDHNGTLFSLRQELFRIRTDQPTADDNLLWKQVLQQHIMSNVMNDPDVSIYCNNIRKSDGSAVPGIVISFSTTIDQGLNFFGWPLAAGDHAYSPSTFATKIYSSGLVFKGYVGMDPYSIGTPGASGPASSSANALSATPYAYLIPAGMDSMRAPPLGDTNVIRTWTVKDQAIPLPKNLGSSSFSATQFFTPQGSLNEQLWITRKHQAFRPVDDPAYFYSSMPAEFTNTRLVGRSVWNSQWKIVIPAYTLLNAEQTGLDRFTQSVSDIKLFLRSYSNSGN